MSTRRPKRSGPANRWPVQDARARFGELIERAQSEGPQVVTRRGEDAVVVVSAKEWQAAQGQASKPPLSIKDWLLDPNARTDSLVPERIVIKPRPLPDFDD